MSASAMYAGFTPDTGYLDVITPADPAAGANLTVDLGSQRWIVIRSVLVTLTTDGNAANRLLSVDYKIGNRATVHRNAAPVLVTASTTAQGFQFSNNRGTSEWNTGTPVFGPLLPLPLQAGWVVAITVDSIQAGDTILSCKLIVERFYADRELDED